MTGVRSIHLAVRLAARSIVCAAGAGLAAAGGASAADLAGTAWATEGGSAHVMFAQEDGGLVGRVAWLRREQETGEAVLDESNPDPALQSRPLLGVAMVWGFDEADGEVWDGGKIYAPDDGKTYNAKIELDGDTLVVTGCIRWPLCRDQTWTRVSVPPAE